MNSIDLFVKERVEHNRIIWLSCAEKSSGLSLIYATEEKKENQKRLQEQLDWISVEINKGKISSQRNGSLSISMGERLKMLGREVLSCSESELAIFEQENLLEISRQFF